MSECYAIEDGMFDIVAIILVENFDEYRSFALDKIGTMKHVNNYTSFITTGE